MEGWVLKKVTGVILRRHEKKEIKSKLNAAAVPLAITFGAEIIQECFEFQLLPQRRFGSALFGIQATVQSREHQQLSSTAHGVHQSLPFFLASLENCFNLDTPKKPFQLITTHLSKIDAEMHSRHETTTEPHTNTAPRCLYPPCPQQGLFLSSQP